MGGKGGWETGPIKCLFACGENGVHDHECRSSTCDESRRGGTPIVTSHVVVLAEGHGVRCWDATPAEDLALTSLTERPVIPSYHRSAADPSLKIPSGSGLGLITPSPSSAQDGTELRAGGRAGGRGPRSYGRCRCREKYPPIRGARECSRSLYLFVPLSINYSALPKAERMSISAIARSLPRSAAPAGNQGSRHVALGLDTRLFARIDY